jgi:hypothetical protein
METGRHYNNDALFFNLLYALSERINKQFFHLYYSIKLSFFKKFVTFLFFDYLQVVIKKIIVMKNLISALLSLTAVFYKVKPIFN